MNAKRKKDYPHWAYPTLRAYRNTKRAELRAAVKALLLARCGSAWHPDGGIALNKIIDDAERLLKELAPAKWEVTLRCRRGQ